MSIQATISNTPVLLESADIKTKLDERDRCTARIADQTQTALYTKGALVSISDTTVGQLFSGFLDKANPQNIIPDPYVHWESESMDNTSIADRIISNDVYTGQYAGNIVLDQYKKYLQAEGVLANFASAKVTTQADWNTGQLTNVQAGDFGDGDLELASSGGVVTKSYQAQADWASGGSASNVQENSDGTVSLIGATRNWNDGNKSGQTLFGNGSPTDGINGSNQYTLSCTHSSETRSRLDFAGTWQNGTIEVDVAIGADIPKTGFSWHSTNEGNADGSWAYALEFTSTQIEIRKGQNSSGGGSTSSLGSYTFSPKLAYGTYRLRIVMSGSSITAYVNGVSRITASDSSYSGAGYISLRNRNGESSVTITDTFDNFGVMASTSGSWTSSSVSVNAVTTVASSIITWDTSASQGGTITVSTSIDGGASYQVCTNGGSIPLLGHGASGTGKSVIVQVSLSTSTTAIMPVIKNLFWNVTGGYQASGTRSTAPLASDTMVRANQSGWGTATDTQTWTKTGTGTDAISSNTATITNTTGDVHERLGSNTATDEDGTVMFQLSASAMTAGIELRYTDSSNFYRLSATTTTLTLSKTVAGTPTTLATATVALSTGVWYHLHFRTTGSASVLLQGRVWADGVAEPTSWAVTATETGAVISALVLYGSNVAATTVTTAGKLSTTTGGTETNVASTPATSVDGYIQLSPLGAANQTVQASIPAMTDALFKGVLYDSTALEGKTIPAGNWSSALGLDGTVIDGLDSLILYYFKRSSGAVWTQIGSITLTSPAGFIGSRQTYAFSATPLAAVSFATGDKLASTCWAKAGSGGWTSGIDSISVYISTSSTQGVDSDWMITTPGTQTTGTGAFTSGGYALMANGTGTDTFENFRVTTYPDTALSLAPVSGSTGSITPLGIDTMIRANQSGSWGNASDSQAWTQAAGTDTPSISGNKAVITSNASGSATRMLLGSGTAVDCDALIRLTIGSTSDSIGIILRSDATAANHYHARTISPTQIRISKRVGGGASDLATFTSGITIAAGSIAWMRFRAQGNTLSMKLWLDGTPEPSSFAGSIADTTFTSGQYGLYCGNSPTSPESYDSFRVTTYPDPALTLPPIGRAGNTSLSWNALTPPNTTLGMDVSLDGVNWADMSGQNGGPIPGIYAQPDPTIDLFNADSSMRYTSTNQTGGSAATVIYDTANSRISLSGGTNAVYLNASLARTDIDLFGDLDIADAGGLVWRFVDSSNFYLLLLSDGSGASSVTTSYVGRAFGGTIPFTNTSGAVSLASLYKIIGVTQSLLAQTSITWTRGKHARFRVTMLGSVITASMDGTQVFTYIDVNPLGKGQVGFFNNGGTTGSRYTELWIQPQGDDLTGMFLYTRQRLATTDSTVTPQVLDMTVTASDPNIGLGALIPQAAYQNTFLSANYADLAQKSDYGWLIDGSNRLIFRGRQAVPAPWILDSNDVIAKQVSAMKVEYGGDTYSNRQVLTGVTDVQAFTDNKIGDSHSQSWPLKFPLATAPTVTLNGVAQSVGVKGIDTGKNWYWQVGDPTIYQDSSGVLLTSSDALAITGMGIYTTTVTRDNLAGQADFKSRAGGTGIVTAVTDVSALGLNIAAAQAYGDMLNARYGKIGRTVTFTSSKPGMVIGQLLSCFIPQRQMSNVSLLIMSVDIAIQEMRIPATTRYVERALEATFALPTNVGMRYDYTVVASELANPGSWARQLAAIMKH